MFQSARTCASSVYEGLEVRVLCGLVSRAGNFMGSVSDLLIVIAEKLFEINGSLVSRTL